MNGGMIKIAKAEDRAEVAKILFDNGYTVTPIRKKRTAKTYEYYILYEVRAKDLAGEENESQV